MYPYIDIFGRQIGTYGLCMMVGFYLAAFFAYRKGKPMGLKVEDLILITATTFGGTLLGGGLLYIFVTYSFEEIIAFIRQGNFSFLASGLVFYGGLVGGVAGALLGVRLTKSNFSVVEKSVIPFIPLGHAIGRVGCVLGGCCHGFPYDGPFAIYYPNSAAGLPADQGYFPVQPLESVLNIGICLLLVWLSKRTKRQTGLLAWYLCFYAIARFFLEMLRGDSIRGIMNGLSTSQYISIAMLVICGLRLLALYLWDKRKAAEAA